MTAAGLSILLCGHTATERGYLPTFAQQLSTRLPSAKFIVSAADADPLRAV
jgi:putative NIF3 family GTP cyclohydrolase 1 type 2